MQINIEDYPVSLTLGYYREERVAEQEVLVSVKIQLHDEVRAGETDELDLTLNYETVLAGIDQAIMGKEVQLIETVVERLGAHLLPISALIAWVEVSVQKLTIPASLARGAKVYLTKRFERR